VISGITRVLSRGKTKVNGVHQTKIREKLRNDERERSFSLINKMLQLHTITTRLLKCQLGRNFEIASTWTSESFLQEGGGEKVFFQEGTKRFFQRGKRC